MKLIASLTSPYARKIRVALAEKALPFELVEDIPWLAETRVPDFNPLGKVPVLLADDGEVWFDSPVIADYLDTLGGPALLPAERRAALPVRQSEALADGICDAAVATFLESRRATPDGAQVSRQLGKIRLGLAALEQRLVAQKGLGGATLNLADIAAGCMLAYLDLRLAALDWRSYHPALAAWSAPVLARPSFAGSVPPAG